MIDSCTEKKAEDVNKGRGNLCSSQLEHENTYHIKMLNDQNDFQKIKRRTSMTETQPGEKICPVGGK